jgi:hypothetical protein
VPANLIFIPHQADLVAPRQLTLMGFERWWAGGGRNIAKCRRFEGAIRLDRLARNFQSSFVCEAAIALSPILKSRTINGGGFMACVMPPLGPILSAWQSNRISP